MLAIRAQLKQELLKRAPPLVQSHWTQAVVLGSQMYPDLQTQTEGEEAFFWRVLLMLAQAVQLLLAASQMKLRQVLETPQVVLEVLAQGKQERVVAFHMYPTWQLQTLALELLDVLGVVKAIEEQGTQEEPFRK
ncbi:unnamed protein product [Sphagnum balticum]